MDKNKLKAMLNKTTGAVASFLTMMITTTQFVYAASAGGTNTYAESGAKWILDGLFWIVVVAAIWTMAMAVIKRSLVGAISTFIGAAIVLTIIDEPTILTSLGTAIKGILGL